MKTSTYRWLFVWCIVLFAISLAMLTTGCEAPKSDSTTNEDDSSVVEEEDDYDFDYDSGSTKRKRR